jgi:phosphatidylglycerophosphatase A
LPEHTSKERLDWFAKARSRLWANAGPDLKAIPPVPLLAGTFFYCGLSPFASGTVGSLAAAILYYVFPALQNPITLAIAIVFVLIIGAWSAGVIERSTGIQDPGIVVIDEVLGQWITYLTLSHVMMGKLSFVITGFLLFRLFDIIKPPPARYFEKQHGGMGVMLDDAVAGIYANIVTHLVLFAITAL